MKKIFTIVLAIALLCSTAAVLGGCADFAGLVDGFDGDGAKYLVYESNGDGTCYVSGINNKGCKKIEIPSTSPDGERVVAIGDGAFADCEHLEEVVIPDSVTEIGEGVLDNCALDSLTLGSGIKRFAPGAFNDSVVIEHTYIESLAAWCGVEFGDANSNPLRYSYDFYADGGSEPVKNLTIPTGVTEIKSYAFVQCDNVEYVTIPGTVKTISSNAFLNFQNLNSVTVGSGVEQIGYGAFKESDISHLTLPFIGASESDSENAYLGYIYGLPLDSEDYGNHDAMYSPRTLTLTGGETIGKGAFNGCDYMESLTLPRSIEYVGESAFEDCERLKEICISDVDAWCNIEFHNYPFSSAHRATLLVLENGQYAPPVEIVIGEGVTSIPSYAFYNIDSIERVVIPEGVTSIGQDAFNSCSGLKTLTLPKSLVEIGNWALGECDNLTDVYYAGTAEEWSNVSLLYHDGLFKNTTIHFGGEAEE